MVVLAFQAVRNLVGSSVENQAEIQMASSSDDEKLMAQMAFDQGVVEVEAFQALLASLV